MLWIEEKKRRETQNHIHRNQVFLYINRLIVLSLEDYDQTHR
jgi:hypothetical protein